MKDNELEKLQRYIYKRPQGQSTTDVIKHIIKIENLVHFSTNDWNKLLIPTCSRPDAELFGWLLLNGAKLEESNENLISSLIGSKEDRLDYQKKRIVVFNVIIENTKKQLRDSLLGEALIYSCWYNNIFIVEYLILNGGNLFYIDKQNKTPFQYAKEYGKRFNDYTLYIYLTKIILKGSNISNSEDFYKKQDLLGNTVYSGK